jgi:threonine synthase
VRELWGSVDKGGAFDLKALMPKLADYGFASGSSNHTNRIDTIREINAKYNLVIDPHTADGLKVASAYLNKSGRNTHTPMLVLETALPAKFEDAITEALGTIPPRPDTLIGIEDLPQKFDVMDVDVAAIQQFIMKHA